MHTLTPQYVSVNVSMCNFLYNMYLYRRLLKQRGGGKLVSSAEAHGMGVQSPFGM
jgi:hypothetical protein